jgi:hypothetical protein
LLSVLVVALPLKGIMLSYTDSASAREVKGSVPRRGLCGDVFLVSQPNGPRIGEAKAHLGTLRALGKNAARIIDKNYPGYRKFSV